MALVGNRIGARNPNEGRSACYLSPDEGSKGTKPNGRDWTRPDGWPPPFQRENGERLCSRGKAAPPLAASIPAASTSIRSGSRRGGEATQGFADS